MAPVTPTALRLATPADAGEIREIVRAAYARWVPLIGREPMPMRVDYDQALREHRFDLLQRGPRILALIETMLEPDHLWIENVAVRPELQGQGLGRRLLAHAEELARAARRTELRLLTNGDFAANIALYERSGYVVTSREPFMGGTTVYMRKAL
ncbi:GNAT family N-acetyltransferase [Neoroseomonas oryzicola]|uniref:GNAT family N-acetyltransferase n=1 Tax=Neoroseomonas oryzicola TaxID=535904 RepID=A0A9X9WNA0_9PROT|nr:GNAT family N-acetyltransferase [Neoroseomonas oryzicola]MBR0661810.1 GNAT family N-acetyltransferase [Neoroseomonas oryzicola]NKE17082.1 GNAT family N-acetyltransferase [Neoroseomonas oryzicola]